MLKTPGFFFSKNLIVKFLCFTGFLAIFPLLFIVEIIFAIKQLFRYILRVKSSELNATILCVGGLICGGSGKTPSAIMIARMILDANFLIDCSGHYINRCLSFNQKEHDFLDFLIKKIEAKSKQRNSSDYKIREPKIAFLSKGYGVSNENLQPHIVTKFNYNFEQHGDEIGELVDYGDVLFVKKRSDIVKIEGIDDYDLIIMDDGLLDKSLEHDIEIVVVDERYGFGNNLSLPFGPIRNIDLMIKILLSFLLKIRYYDIAFIVSSNGLFSDSKKSLTSITEKSYFVATDTISGNYYNNISQNCKYIAFSGIGINQKFFSSLIVYGLDLVETIGFADHHRYTEDDLQKLIKKKNEYDDCKLITTRKDFNRICRLNMRNDIIVFSINFQITCK